MHAQVTIELDSPVFISLELPDFRLDIHNHQASRIPNSSPGLCTKNPTPHAKAITHLLETKKTGLANIHMANSTGQTLQVHHVAPLSIWNGLNFAFFLLMLIYFNLFSTILLLFYYYL